MRIQSIDRYVNTNRCVNINLQELRPCMEQRSNSLVEFLFAVPAAKKFPQKTFYPRFVPKNPNFTPAPLFKH